MLPYGTGFVKIIMELDVVLLDIYEKCDIFATVIDVF